MSDRLAKHCIRCGTALKNEVIAGRERPICPACGFIVYRNPIPVAVMVARRAGEFLLIRRRDEPLRGFWAPPTGYLEWDESAEEAAVREAREETGLAIRLEGLLGVYSRADTGVLFAAYWGEVVGGEAQAAEDAEAAAFFAPDRLPPQPATHRGELLDGWFLEVIEDVLKQAAKRLS